MAQSEPTIADILQELSSQYKGIVAEREVMDRVLERKPSRAKDPYAGIREKLRYDAPRVGWVRLGGGELIPLRVALEGLRFRVIPNDDEFAGDMIAWTKLAPFVNFNSEMRLEDAAGRPLKTHRDALPVGQGAFGTNYSTAVHLGDWFTRQGFEPGDSIIMTIRSTEPIILRLEREPAAEFREQDVRDQERELLDGIAEQLARGRTDMLFPQESVLPIYARAPWRTGYPARPWQQLVAADPRLRFVDELYIADSSYRRPFDRLFGTDEQDEQQWEALDDTLLTEIVAFQAELRASRREAAANGLWDGVAPRVSTATILLNPSEGTTTTIYDGPIDTLRDYSAVIDQRAARGEYGDAVEDQEFDADDLDDEDFDEDDLFDMDDIEDMQAFLEQNPELIEATRKLMTALTPDEIAQLQEARTPDEAQRILTERLNDLLRRDPSLFAALEPLPAPVGHNGHANGNGHAPPDETEDEEEWDADELFGEEEWDDEDDEDDEEEDGAQVDAALERSNELMERFYQYQRAQGKSETTAAGRTGDLWVYADFLGTYYALGLDAGDYATLDECLFFFYPRKVLNSTPRDARDMCTSIKQFYAFLRAEGIVTDDGFAQAIWRRRDQAARIVELYGRLDAESPRFGRLFGRLFEPFTA
ncbi:MAG TPA: hypothetical protein VF897_18430 [Roseiflexaceae bacterium]